MGHQKVRYFSAATTEKENEGSSIFSEADFFKEDGTASQQSMVDSHMQKDEMFWVDSTDSCNAFQAALLKDSSNLPQGVSTYGPCEYLSYTSDIIFNSWMTCSQFGGMGMCGGLILTALATKAVFLPT